MVTTNILQLVHELDRISAVSVNDLADTIELHVSKPVDIGEMDDLICDALFVDPLDRQENAHAWTINLYKREHLRGASDMEVKELKGRSVYVLRPAA